MRGRALEGPPNRRRNRYLAAGLVTACALVGSGLGQLFFAPAPTIQSPPDLPGTQVRLRPAATPLSLPDRTTFDEALDWELRERTLDSLAFALSHMGALPREDWSVEVRFSPGETMRGEIQQHRRMVLHMPVGQWRALDTDRQSRWAWVIIHEFIHLAQDLGSLPDLSEADRWLWEGMANAQTLSIAAESNGAARERIFHQGVRGMAERCEAGLPEDFRGLSRTPDPHNVIAYQCAPLLFLELADGDIPALWQELAAAYHDSGARPALSRVASARDHGPAAERLLGPGDPRVGRLGVVAMARSQGVRAGDARARGADAQ